MYYPSDADGASSTHPHAGDQSHNPFVEEPTVEQIEQQCEMELGLGEPTDQEIKAMRNPLLMRPAITDTFARGTRTRRNESLVSAFSIFSHVSSQLNRHVL